MKKSFALIAATLALSGCSQPTPQEQLTQTIDEMITAIDNKDKRLLLDQFLDNQDLTEHNLTDKEMRRFKLALESANVATATLKTTATINIEGDRHTLTFVKVGDNWRFAQ